jgi:hypothetical protein
MDGMMLTTENQKKIVEEIHYKFNEYISKCRKTKESSTFTPYFDITLTDAQKGTLHEVPVSSLIKDRVKNELMKSNFKAQV